MQAIPVMRRRQGMAGINVTELSRHLLKIAKAVTSPAGRYFRALRRALKAFSTRTALPGRSRFVPSISSAPSTPHSYGACSAWPSPEGSPRRPGTSSSPDPV